MDKRQTNTNADANSVSAPPHQLFVAAEDRVKPLSNFIKLPNTPLPPQNKTYMGYGISLSLSGLNIFARTNLQHFTNALADLMKSCLTKLGQSFLEKWGACESTNQDWRQMKHPGFQPSPCKYGLQPSREKQVARHSCRKINDEQTRPRGERQPLLSKKL